MLSRENSNRIAPGANSEIFAYFDELLNSCFLSDSLVCLHFISHANVVERKFIHFATFAAVFARLDLISNSNTLNFTKTGKRLLN